MAKPTVANAKTQAAAIAVALNAALSDNISVENRRGDHISLGEADCRRESGTALCGIESHKMT